MKSAPKSGAMAVAAVAPVGVLGALGVLGVRVVGASAVDGSYVPTSRLERVVGGEVRVSVSMGGPFFRRWIGVGHWFYAHIRVG